MSLGCTENILKTVPIISSFIVNQQILISLQAHGHCQRRQLEQANALTNRKSNEPQLPMQCDWSACKTCGPVCFIILYLQYVISDRNSVYF
ncbi:hypothetical protein XELAEV_18045872mg [Xenopus laevis]|uniref:Uncharacterized protein n=1 Tax=Xenopus laevis TaxID=8355 RepID=A0A974H025_XENLA|nr:hypothetical protein XELAEV_18045872mg [Xenopus laevis]